ncbi:thioester reductase domain-containing protein, partial [Myxococcota bacterium]|nr:thioester reductase domain-containing protein [Myxococcota bacterium]
DAMPVAPATPATAALGAGGATDGVAALAPGELDALVAELLGADLEEEVALRGEARYVQRLVRREDAVRRAARPRTALTDVPARLEIPSPGALDAMVFRPRPRRAPGAGEVEVAVHAGAINFRDVMKALGIYPGDAPDAAVLGDEGAGVVTRVGPGVTRFAPGDAVMGVGGGYFGAYVTVPEAFLLPKPAHLSFEEASTVLVAYMTAWHALHTLGRMRAGERVLVHAGTGGVGLAAVALVQAAGGVVFATAGSAEKRAFLRGLGVEHVFDSRTLAFADEIMEVTGGRGVDLVLNSLAGDAIEKSLGVLGPRGRFLEIGKRDIYGNTRIGLRPFRNNLSYSAIDLGATMEPGFVGPFLAELGDGFARGTLRALPHRVFPIGDAAGAFRAMTHAKQIGKLVLRVAGESVPLDLSPAERPVELGADATYVVTGGNGGFGLETARWLVERGARHVVITSRSGRADERVLAELRARGADVAVMRSDVASDADVRALFAELARTRPPVRGVFHSAMVLDDGVIGQLDGARFHAVMAPKAHGAWNLHDATRTLALDHFVLYSSVSAVIGNPGQASYAAANAALDALAGERQRLGLAGTAVNWGLLGEVGVVTRNAKLVEHFGRMGMGALTTREALGALGRLLREGATQTSVLRVDWSKWGASTARGPGPRYTHLIGAGAVKSAAKADGRALKAELATSSDGAKEKVERYLREQVGQVLRTPPARIAEDLVLTELGLDSLMAVELIHRLEGELGVHLPTGKLMGQPTIAKMSGVLVDVLTGKKAAAPAEPALLPPKPAVELSRDATLEADVHLDLAAPAPIEPFGAHVVAELLATTSARVYGLVDAPDAAAGVAELVRRVREVAEVDVDAERLVAVLGDVAKPRLGLTDERFAALADEVDAIIHNGARFNHVASYAALKAANVDATIDVLRLASTGPTKPVVYVSGLASLTAHVCQEGAPMRETDPLPATGRLVGGYAQSRWVAEKILGLAIERGFPVSIHRPGLLLGDVGSTAINADDLSWRAVKACLDVGAVPKGDWDVFFTPVSWARRALVTLSRRVDALGHTFHLVPPERRRLTDLVRPAADAGYTLVELPREEWEARVIAEASKGTASPILPYLMFLPPEVLAAFRAVPGFPAVDTKNVETALAGALPCPPIDPALVRALAALDR